LCSRNAISAESSSSSSSTSSSSTSESPFTSSSSQAAEEAEVEADVEVRWKQCGGLQSSSATLRSAFQAGGGCASWRRRLRHDGRRCSSGGGVTDGRAHLYLTDVGLF
jgi:hypothetical protein